MKILSCDEVRQAEREAISRPGGSTLALMQRAGHAVAQFCLANFEFRSVCVVCGKGNNGGDGLVAAQALRQTLDVSVIILARGPSELSPDAQAMCSRLGLDPLWISGEVDLESEQARKALASDLILDAIVGTGFKPPLRGLAKAAVAAINRAPGAVVSVDLPSGVDADNTTPVQMDDGGVVFCHGIITFIAPKPAHVFGKLTVGPVAVSEIGVRQAPSSKKEGLEVITGREIVIAFPPRPSDAHKGLFGHVLVVAGSVGKAGAAGLAGMAALRTGAGLVTVACPRSIQSTVAAFAPELMTEGLPETNEGTLSLTANDTIDRLSEGKDSIVLGPGLSTNSETSELVRRLVAKFALPLVLDADGLNAFAGRCPELKRLESRLHVLTPHPGEAARLLEIPTAEIQKDRQAAAARLAQATGSAVVLKGSGTVVTGASGETWINMSGNPALAKGGSGDVLSGMIGAALARGSKRKQLPVSTGHAFSLEMNVASAVHLHGLAADIALETLHENTVLATDLLNNLSGAFHHCQRQSERELFYLQK
jgi:NAD(P)H-hydrate epimerase